ncbi:MULTISPECIES: hypothetical protein [unclassified Caballeronia]|uniref:hypothetical protein n=1 Tax=unclassified Caballeronia TaxID=2646786 RepID=UPI002029715F|nr:MULTISPECIES: hypothetical protein [unclassified Caballeronia]MDR5770108.1 hypothetical protein [Caballeronia sp. LZ028]
MRKLALPTFAPVDVLSTCVSGVTDAGLVERLEAVKATLLSTADNYDQRARASELHLVPRVAQVGDVAKAELEKLYDGHMSPAKSAARKYYDVLRSAAPHRKCPLCGIGVVSALDHHLPKSKYPDLAVCPYNLVPICDFCNKAKLSSYPKEAGQQTIHPYYDDFTQEQWICARLDIEGPPALTFYVSPPPHWDEIRRLRAQRHFDIVKLGLSYTSNANEDMSSLRGHLESIENREGAAGVLAHLRDECNRYIERLNSWQHVMYQTLANHAWFVAGGFRNIPKPNFLVK